MGPSPYAQVMSVPPPTPSVKFGTVLIHIGTLQFVVNMVGFTIGYLGTSIGTSLQASSDSVTNFEYLAVLVLGTLAAIITFFIIGLRVDTAIRWQHLALVAFGTVILTLIVNSILTQQNITVVAIVFAMIQTFFAMGVGGGLAALIRPNRRRQQPAPQAAVPQYQYGAWPNQPQYPQPGPQQYAPQYPPQPPQGTPQYPGAPGSPAAQPGYGQQPQPQYPAQQPPAGWGQQPGAQPPMYPVPQYPPNQQQGNTGNR